MKKILFFLLLSQLYFSQQWSISFAERAALISIYSTTNGEEWSQQWDFDKDPKFWYGIKIRNGFVSEINLRGNALKGNFPSVSVFSKLRKLDLSNNLLTGEVSPSLSALNTLVRLDISNNRLTGDPSSVILPLTNLTEISLGNNDFQIANIDQFLQNFPQLKILDLAHFGLNAVPQKISSLTNLEALNLSNNNISQNFSNLSTLNKLTELNIAGNKLLRIPAEIATLIALKSLDASHNLFSANYSAALNSLVNLEWLSLAGNQIAAFPAELPQLKKLVHLNFSDNRISGGCEALLVLKDLEQIFLDKNQLSGNFPAPLLQFSKLQMISLRANQLSGAIPGPLPALTFLDNNRFSRQEIKNFILNENNLTDFTYSPQRYDEAKTISAALGSSATLPQSLSGNELKFTWFKNLDQNTLVSTENYHISSVEEDDFADYTSEAYLLEQLPSGLMEISFFREPVTLLKDLATDEVSSDLIIYPNPTTDYLHIKTNRLDVENIFIFDLSGKLLMTGKLKTIDVRHLPAAAYIISIKTESGIKSFKFLKH